MKTPKDQTRTRLSLFSSVVLTATCLLVVSPSSPGYAAVQSPVLEFIQPTNGALFSTLDEIPIVLRAFASNDVFLTGEVFAHNDKIGDVSYCCSFCPCFRPRPGDETTLQVPVPWQNDRPPTRPWQGWTNVSAGRFQLTAHATGDNGTMVEAAPVTITVIDRTVRISVGQDGHVILVIQQGSLVPGGYDCYVSDDLKNWTRLGPFEPGNVAAFYFDVPPETAREKRFYRSLYVPPP